MSRRPIVQGFVPLLVLLLASACGEDDGGFTGADAAPPAADVVDAVGPGEDAGGGADVSACPPAGCAPEICDGIDNDGDGAVDEELERACNSACGSGTETCVSGSWLGCDAPQPATESCDGRDNDCDGRVDEDLVRVCETACGSGNEMCSLGAWTGCNAPPVRPETCNGEDDDCDGPIDEGLTRPCSSACGDGAEVCADGEWGDCSAREPDPDGEQCGDNVDNDCDGDTDEDCGLCPVGNTTVCQGLGEDLRCRFGTRVCADDGSWGPCTDLDSGAALADPTEEVCNGRDDDCDGGVDESFPTEGDPCGEGPDGAPVTEGACEAGALACEDGVEVCQGAIGPRDEVCDGRDDDCDGLVDEDLPRDAYERNDACASAATIGVVREGSPALTWAGSVYPFGDVDYYYVNVEEGGGWCVPAVNPDEDYVITVTLSNVPEGVGYDLCVTIDDRTELPSAFCDDEGERLLEETCLTVEPGEDGATVTHVVVTDCGLADHTSVLIEVIPSGDAPISCESYALSVSAETAVPEE